MIANGSKALPVGRTLRLVLGVLLVIEGGRHLIGAGPGTLGRTAAVFAGEFLIYAALHLLIVRLVPNINRWVGAFVAVAPVVLIFMTSNAPGRLGTLLFVGVSLVFTALRNDAGCEVMTLPGMVFGRRTHLVCIAFCPIDWVESRVRRAAKVGP